MLNVLSHFKFLSILDSQLHRTAGSFYSCGFSWLMKPGPPLAAAMRDAREPMVASMAILALPARFEWWLACGECKSTGETMDSIGGVAACCSYRSPSVRNYDRSASVQELKSRIQTSDPNHHFFKSYMKKVSHHITQVARAGNPTQNTYITYR